MIERLSFVHQRYNHNLLLDNLLITNKELTHNHIEKAKMVKETKWEKISETPK